MKARTTILFLPAALLIASGPTAALEWIDHTLATAIGGVGTIQLADLDDDGDLDLDLAGAVHGADEVTWWENGDGAGDEWIAHPLCYDFDGAMGVCAADLDGDGDQDLLAAAYWDGVVAWWENDDHGGGWTRHLIDDDYYTASSVAATDLDGDGDLDLAGAVHGADEVTWWENGDGAGDEWIAHPLCYDFDGAMGVCAADLDGDGDQDLIVTHNEDSGVAWYVNVNGQGTSWVRRLVDEQMDNSFDAVAVDLDDDGDCDIVSGTMYLPFLSFYENCDGLGLSFARRVIEEMIIPRSLVVTDLDDDGDPDILAANSITDGVIWFEQSALDIDDARLEAPVVDEGVLLDWTVYGDQPAAVRILRGAEDPVPVSGDLSRWRTNWLDRRVTPEEACVYWLEVTGDYGLTELYGPTEPVVMPGTARGLTLYDPYPSPAADVVALGVPRSRRSSSSSR